MRCQAARYGRAAAFVLLALIAAYRADSRGAAEVTLLYVGADDCAPCRAWQRKEKIAFTNSVDFTRLKYREVKSPTLFDVLADENWPEDLRPYRSLLGPDAGVPLWLVIADGRVIRMGMGPHQWNSDVLPSLTTLLR